MNFTVQYNEDTRDFEVLYNYGVKMEQNELRELAFALEGVPTVMETLKAAAYLREQADRQERGVYRYLYTDNYGKVKIAEYDPPPKGAFAVYLHPAPQSVPDGYWLAPMEPTQKMTIAGMLGGDGRQRLASHEANQCYLAMRDAYITASPAAPMEVAKERCPECNGFGSNLSVEGEGEECNVCDPAAPAPTSVQAHDIFKTGDAGVPTQIKDRNGEVALRLCKRCGRGEIELDEPCSPAPADVVEALRELIEAAKNAIHAGRQIEHYEHPSVRPLSEDNFRFYESARKTEIRLERAMTSARAALAAADQKERGNG